jgi:hypothetical protein
MNGYEIASVIGAIGGVIGTIAGLWGLRVNQQTRRNEYPDMVEGWTALDIGLRSRSNLGYRIEQIKVLAPRGGVLADYDLVAQDPASGAPIFEIKQQGRTLPLKLSVAHAGKATTSRAPYGGGLQTGLGEEHHQSILLSVPASTWSSNLFSRWRARSDSSQIMRVSFRVRLIDQNDEIAVQTKTIRFALASTTTNAKE